MGLGAWVLVAAVLLAVAVGGWRALTDGRFRGTHRLRGVEAAGDGADGTAGTREEDAVDRDARPDEGSVLAQTPWADELGERATLLQFSSAFCAPCRATRRVLADVAERTEGVRHVEVDAEHHLDLVRRVGVLRTPTTLVLDSDGREVTRAAGAPRPAQVEAVLGALTGDRR